MEIRFCFLVDVFTHGQLKYEDLGASPSIRLSGCLNLKFLTGNKPLEHVLLSVVRI